MELSLIIFSLFILSLFTVGLWASFRRKGNENEDYFLASRTLKWYLVAISAGATANSGFIVTGAVGLGYTLGVSAILLPLSWFLGDLVFWSIFPHKINKLSRAENAKTIGEFLTFDFVKGAKIISVITGLILIFATATYTIAQWAAAAVTFTGFYNVSVTTGILVAGILVTFYCIFGGFRSSVYVDLVQGAFMVLLTTVAIIFCLSRIGGFSALSSNQALINDGYLNLFKGLGVVSALGFIIGWASASLGFGLSQPHIVDKYFAGRTEGEVRKAKWLYLLFVQYTWVGMTFLGVLIKYLIPDMSNAEAALSTLVSQNSNQILKGVIVCGVFATIASTADSLMIATSNSIRNDVLSNIAPNLKYPRFFNQFLTLSVAIVTITVAVIFDKSSVFDLAVFAILLGATISPAMIIKIFGLRNNHISLSLCIIAALAAALIWQRVLNLNGFMNQAIVGIIVGLLVNYIVSRFFVADKVVAQT
jgi:Na+/proline symporter